MNTFSTSKENTVITDLERLKQTSAGKTHLMLEALPYLLAQAERYDRLYILLTDFNFIKSKLRIFRLGRRSLIEDCNLLLNSKAKKSCDWSKSKSRKIIAIKKALKSFSGDELLTAIQKILGAA